MLLHAVPALAGSTAYADDMDVSLARLRMPTPGGPGCPNATAPEGPHGCFPDNDAYLSLMSQLGAALAPPVLEPAHTTGLRGFHLSFETGITGIDDAADYWQRGTEGDAESGVEGRNRFVRGVVPWSRLALRKGFPGFELGASVGRAYDTRLWMWGASVKIAILEGFRHGPWAFIPDLSVRAAVHTMTGDSEFSLSVPSVDVILSKPIVLLDTVTLTPWVAPQIYWVIADSEVVDLTPEINAFDQCMPLSTPPVAGDQGTLRCTGSAADFENDATFTDMRALRARIAIGLQLRASFVTMSGAFHIDLIEPSADGVVPAGLARQWTVAFGVGAEY